MKRYFSSLDRTGWLLLATVTQVSTALAQTDAKKELIDAPESGGLPYLTIALMILAGLGGAYYFWRKSKKGSPEPKYNYEARSNKIPNKNGTYAIEGVDADRDLAWLRKPKKSKPKPGAVSFGPRKAAGTASTSSSGIEMDPNLDAKAFQEKMRKLRYAQLPINSFTGVTPAKLYEPLPYSDDESLTNAIEQANEEFEEDESVRDLAVRVLTAFRTRNSVDSLSQIALYDLSSSLRSKAVASLTDFDHESVFEAILLACADPTREVRAAAARGLFRLNFDRADAWKRIVETGDEFRMSHAARAAIEAGIVAKSFDRLVHEDLKVAYEAFTLVSLLIRSGETSEIFEAIRNHRDERVKFALLHVLKVNQDERTLTGLNELRLDTACPTDVVDRVRDTVQSFASVPA